MIRPDSSCPLAVMSVIGWIRHVYWEGTERDRKHSTVNKEGGGGGGTIKDMVEQLQRNVLTYTTTHKQQLKTQALSSHGLHLSGVEERQKIIKEEGSKEED